VAVVSEVAVAACIAVESARASTAAPADVSAGVRAGSASGLVLTYSIGTATASTREGTIGIGTPGPCGTVCAVSTACGAAGSTAGDGSGADVPIAEASFTCSALAALLSAAVSAGVALLSSPLSTGAVSIDGPESRAPGSVMSVPAAGVRLRDFFGFLSSVTWPCP